MSLISVFPLGLYQFLVLFLGCLFLSFCIFLPLNVCFFVQSVGFTAAPLFLISAFWFLGFGMYLLIICFRHCCSQRQHYVYEKKSNALSLSFLVLFTTATMLQFLSLSLSLSLSVEPMFELTQSNSRIVFDWSHFSVGCVVLYTGQGKFHSSTTSTLEYIVKHKNSTVQNLKNVSNYLSTAKQLGVDQYFMPSNVQANIDNIQIKINASTTFLEEKKDSNPDRIQHVLDSVWVKIFKFVHYVCSLHDNRLNFDIEWSMAMCCRQLALIIIAAVMLLLSLTGFCKWIDLLIIQMIGVLNYIKPLRILSHFVSVTIGCSLLCCQPAASRIHVSRITALISNLLPFPCCFWGVSSFSSASPKCLWISYDCSLATIAWILVAGTFILCGVFLLLHK